MQDVFTGLSRGVPGLRPRDMAPPAAEFEAPDCIAAAASLRYEPHKLFLGVIGATIERDLRTKERYAQGGIEIGAETDQHAILIAGSRTGKGRACIQTNLLKYAGSILAIDPKGELAVKTAAARKKLGQRVCVLDPFDTTKRRLEADYYAGFNPVALMGENSMIEDAILIADALVVPEGRDPHWDESARTFIEGVILEVRTAEIRRALRV